MGKKPIYFVARNKFMTRITSSDDCDIYEKLFFKIII